MEINTKMLQVSLLSAVETQFRIVRSLDLNQDNV